MQARLVPRRSIDRGRDRASNAIHSTRGRRSRVSISHCWRQCQYFLVHRRRRESDYGGTGLTRMERDSLRLDGCCCEICKRSRMLPQRWRCHLAHNSGRLWFPNFKCSLCPSNLQWFEIVCCSLAIYWAAAGS